MINTLQAALDAAEREHGEAVKAEHERDELRALWTAEQQHHRQTARECGDAKEERDAARAEAEELRLTLAAEQGKPEGAPSEGWVYEHGDWIKTYPDGSQAMVSGQRGRRQWMRASWPDTTRPPTYYGRGFDVATDRAAMIAADEVSNG